MFLLEPPSSTPSMSPTTSNSLKRSSSPTSSLDCQSLQSSLKRVRLSCSPGELRLQRDIRGLPATGWIQEQDNRVNASQCWKYRDPSLSAELYVLDPLRLVLHVHLPGHDNPARIWIQVPRMYPHRPPSISRIENLGIERIVIVDALPTLETPKQTTSEGDSSNIHCGSSVLVYDQWSPVRNLGDLLQFLLSGISNGSQRGNQTWGLAVSSSSSSSMLESLALDGGSSSMDGCDREDDDSPTLSMAPLYFENQRNNQSVVGPNPLGFAANRFDVGYSKYSDPCWTSYRSPGTIPPMHNTSTLGHNYSTTIQDHDMEL